MLKSLLLLALCLAFSLICLAQGKSQSGSKAAQSQDYQEIERLEIEWNAINEVSDAEGKQRMLADDSYHVSPNGRVYNKTQDVADQRLARERKMAANSFPKFIIRERRIRLYKDAAVVTGLGITIVTKEGQQRISGQFRFIHVWERRDGRWQLAIDQVTAVR